MKASYIWELIESKKEDVLSFSEPTDRMRMIIQIIKHAPVPPDTPSGFAFIDTLNVESGALLQVCEMYEKSGRCHVLPINSFSETETDNVRSVLEKIYELCETDTK